MCICSMINSPCVLATKDVENLNSWKQKKELLNQFAVSYRLPLFHGVEPRGLQWLAHSLYFNISSNFDGVQQRNITLPHTSCM